MPPPELLFVPQVAPYVDSLRVPVERLDLTVEGARPPGFGYPVAWSFSEGSGRVFTTALGHFPAAWESPAYLRHVHGGLQSLLDPGSEGT